MTEEKDPNELIPKGKYLPTSICWFCLSKIPPHRIGQHYCSDVCEKLAKKKIRRRLKPE